MSKLIQKTKKKKILNDYKVALALRLVLKQFNELSGYFLKPNLGVVVIGYFYSVILPIIRTNCSHSS